MLTIKKWILSVFCADAFAFCAFAFADTRKAMASAGNKNLILLFLSPQGTPCLDGRALRLYYLGGASRCHFRAASSALFRRRLLRHLTQRDPARGASRVFDKHDHGAAPRKDGRIAILRHA